MIRFSRIRIFSDGTEPYFGAAVEVASCNRGTATMKKAAEAHNPKENDRRDSSKPGTIVAGPEAHAREGAGKMPAGRSVKSEKPAKEPASRS
ncbi:hypothetical protein ABIE33_006942 [Ensifer sp. 4252]